MFIPKTIIEYNNRIDREIDENNSVYFATMNKISFFESFFPLRCTGKNIITSVIHFSGQMLNHLLI